MYKISALPVDTAGGHGQNSSHEERFLEALTEQIYTSNPGLPTVSIEVWIANDVIKSAGAFV